MRSIENKGKWPFEHTVQEDYARPYVKATISARCPSGCYVGIADYFRSFIPAGYGTIVVRDPHEVNGIWIAEMKRYASSD